MISPIYPISGFVSAITENLGFPSFPFNLDLSFLYPFFRDKALSVLIFFPLLSSFGISKLLMQLLNLNSLLWIRWDKNFLPAGILLEELIRNSLNVFNRENQNIKISFVGTFTVKFHFSITGYIEKREEGNMEAMHKLIYFCWFFFFS